MERMERIALTYEAPVPPSIAGLVGYMLEQRKDRGFPLNSVMPRLGLGIHEFVDAIRSLRR
jgi:hypothetical protein